MNFDLGDGRGQPLGRGYGVEGGGEDGSSGDESVASSIMLGDDVEGGWDKSVRIYRRSTPPPFDSFLRRCHCSHCVSAKRMPPFH